MTPFWGSPIDVACTSYGHDKASTPSQPLPGLDTVYLEYPHDLLLTLHASCHPSSQIFLKGQLQAPQDSQTAQVTNILAMRGIRGTMVLPSSPVA